MRIKWMASGQRGLRGVSAQCRVERVSDLATGSVPVPSDLAVDFHVLVLAGRIKCASLPHVTVSKPFVLICQQSVCLIVSYSESDPCNEQTLIFTCSRVKKVVFLDSDMKSLFLLQLMGAGVIGVTGQSAPSHVVGGFKAAGDTVTAPLLRGMVITVRGWEQKSEPVTLTTVQVL